MQTPSSNFQDLILEASNSLARALKRAAKEFAFKVAAKMKAQGLRHQDIAERLSVSRPYVTQVLSGTQNCTIETMVKIAHELNCDVVIDLEERPKAEAISTFKVIERSKGKTTTENWHSATCLGTLPSRGVPPFILFVEEKVNKGGNLLVRSPNNYSRLNYATLFASN